MKKVEIHPIDLEEVMVYMTQKRKEYEEDSGFDIHQEFFDKFEVTSEQFENILGIILPMVDIGESSLTKKTYLFLADKEDGTALLQIALYEPI